MPAPAWKWLVGCACCRNDFLIAGGATTGNTALTDADSYNVAGDAWRSESDLPAGRAVMGSSSLESGVYVYGGWAAGAVQADDNYQFSDNAWATKTAMGTGRVEFASSPADGKAFAISGRELGDITPLALVEAYDPGGDSWGTGTNMPNPKRYPPGASIDDKIYCFGGRDLSANFYRTNYEYDAINDAWTTKTDMPTPERAEHGGGTIGGHAYSFGGSRFGDGNIDDVDEYDPSGDSWSSVASLLDDRKGGKFLSGGSVGYYIGGVNALGVPQQTVFEFDGSTWTAKAVSIPSPARSSLSGGAIQT